MLLLSWAGSHLTRHHKVFCPPFVVMAHLKNDEMERNLICFFICIYIEAVHRSLKFSPKWRLLYIRYMDEQIEMDEDPFVKRSSWN